MNDAATLRPGRRRLAGLLALPLRGLTAALELPLSRRGLPLAFLGMAVVVTLAGWVRPPLSPDLRSFHIPLGLTSADGPAPEQILDGPRRFLPDSVGTLLLVGLAVGALVVAWCPEAVGSVAGALVCAALCANAAVAFNHPGLVELMDREYEQRQQIASARPPDAVSSPANARVGILGAPSEDDQRGDLARGVVYLLYGRWLILLAAGGVLLGSRGSLGRRLGYLGAWSVLGLGLAGLVCSQRLRAEYHWAQAQHLEARGDYEESRQALDAALDLCPELESLQRTWLLAGKLDQRRGRASAQQRHFQAYQLARDKERPRAFTSLEDLPWIISGLPDYRQGLAPLPSGFDLSESPEAVGTLDFLEGLSGLQGKLVGTYRQTRERERRQALALMDDQVAAGADRSAAVRRQAAQLWVDTGLLYYRLPPLYTDVGTSYFAQEQQLGAAQDAWERALRLDPGRRDCSFYLGTTWAGIDPGHPELAAAAYAALLDRLADPILRADVEASLGQVYMRGGRLPESRRYFAESYETFSLPKRINFRAQALLGGL